MRMGTRDLDAASLGIPALVEGAGGHRAYRSNAMLMTLIAAGRVERAPRKGWRRGRARTVRAWALVGTGL